MSKLKETLPRRQTRKALFSVALTAVGLVVGLSFAQSSMATAEAESGSLTTLDNTQSACTATKDLKLQDQDHEDDQLPWQRKNGEEVVIYFETRNTTPEYLNYMKKGVTSWDSSPCIRPRLIDRCPAGVNCVTVGLEDSDGGGDDGNFDSIEKKGFTVGGHISYYVDRLAEEGPIATLNVVVHEMGHAVGLRHRLTRNVLMHGDTNNTTEPDDIDYQNLLVLYGKQ